MAILGQHTQSQQSVLDQAGPGGFGKKSADTIKPRLSIRRGIDERGHRPCPMADIHPSHMGCDVPLKRQRIKIQRLAISANFDPVLEQGIGQNLAHGGPAKHKRLDHQQARVCGHVHG